MSKIVNFTEIKNEPTCSKELDPNDGYLTEENSERVKASIKNRRPTPYTHFVKEGIEPLVILKVNKDKPSSQTTPKKGLTPTTNEPTVVEVLNESREKPVTVITVGRKRRRLRFLTFKMKLFTLIYFAVFIILICITMFTPVLQTNVQYFLGALLGVYCLSYFIVFAMICNQYHQTQGLWTLTVNAEQHPHSNSIPLSTVSTEVSG